MKCSSWILLRRFLLRESAEEKSLALKNLFDEIYFRDIEQRNKIKNIGDAEKRAQEIRPFRKINDSFKKIIITKDIVPMQYDDYGILTMNVYDFLLNKEILQGK